MYTVIRQPLFELMRQAVVHPDSRRCDEVLAAVEWAIATKPFAFPPVQGTRLRVVKTDHFRDVLGLLVYFTIDNDSTCTLRGIEALESPAALDEDDIPL